MTKDDEIQGCKKRILELERENDELRKENAALRNRDYSRRGVPEEELIAKLTGGKRTRYKDGHYVTTKSGHLLEVKHSKVDRPGPSKTLRWTWAGVLGLNGTKKYDFLVLMGKKDPGHPEYNAQYPDYAVPKGIEALLDYVTFLVPREAVDSIRSGNSVALNINLEKARARKPMEQKRYLVRSLECWRRHGLLGPDGGDPGSS